MNSRPEVRAALISRLEWRIWSGPLIIRPALDTPFLLLPFRPSSDPSAARTFIRNYFNQSFEKGSPVNGDVLVQELRLTEPMVRKLVSK